MVVTQKIRRCQNHVSRHVLVLVANKAQMEPLTKFWLESNCNFILQLVCEDSIVK